MSTAGDRPRFHPLFAIQGPGRPAPRVKLLRRSGVPALLLLLLAAPATGAPGKPDAVRTIPGTNAGSIPGPDTGTITGQVTDDAGQPLGYANVLIVGMARGASTAMDGTYRIAQLPPGRYGVEVRLIGYARKRVEAVPVEAGREARADFRIARTPVADLPTVEVEARRDILHKNPQVTHETNVGDLTTLPITGLIDVITLKPSVVAQGGELHFRGGRGDEVQVQIDGVPVRDPLNGATATLATFGVESTEQIMGGLDAEYGNAQSGVVNYKTREGTNEFKGEMTYLTDDYGSPENTFENLQKLFVGLGGPAPLRNLTYYVAGEGTFQDGYPADGRDRVHHRILNLVSVGDRQDNRVRLQGKLAYRPDNDSKLTAQLIREQARYDTYYHEWSRSGYVQTFRDTTQDGQVVVRNGRWSPAPVDSTYRYYNAADHTPLYRDEFTSAELAWTHSLNAVTFYNLKLNRNAFDNDCRVQNKAPWEYNPSSFRDFWYDYTDNSSSDYYVTAGDFPEYYTRQSKIYTAIGDLTRNTGRHTMKTGFEATYNDLRYLDVQNPFTTDAAGRIGTRTEYHYYNPEGSFYLEDRWEHEGMFLSAGARYDFFSVGPQLAIDQVQERLKKQFSPRVGIAYPISDRDVFSFHYGRLYQIPLRQYIFDNLNVYDGRPRGNPNLTNETTVTYQAAIQHLFSEILSGQFAVYYRDMFGLVDTQQEPSLGSVQNLVTFVNRAYASARGFEATLDRRMSDGFSGEINYSFGVATGVASDPNAQTVLTYAYYPVSEQPLNWDVRHMLNVTLTMLQPGGWTASLVWRYASGLPFTPWGRNTRELKPELENSRRLPGTTSLDIQVDKLYQLWGQRFRLFLQSRNVLDSPDITSLDPGNWPPPPGLVPEAYTKFYTETGKAGGAYLGPDTNGDGLGDWVPLHDPRVFMNPRSIQMGVGYSF